MAGVTVEEDAWLASPLLSGCCLLRFEFGSVLPGVVGAADDVDVALALIGVAVDLATLEGMTARIRRCTVVVRDPEATGIAAQW